MNARDMLARVPSSGSSPVVQHPSQFPFRTTINPGRVECAQCGTSNAVHDSVYIKVISCAKCSAVLDASSGRVRSKRNRPMKGVELPLESRGTLRGKAVMVVGVVRYRDRAGNSWHEYTLINEDGEYRSLLHDEAHFVLFRDLPRPPIGASELANNAQERAPIKLDGRTYVAALPETAEVVAVLGQHNFDVAPDEKITEIEAFRPPDVISVSPDAREFSVGEWLHPDEVGAAFGSPFPMPDWGHRAQPVWRSSMHKLVTMTLLVLSLVGLVAAIYLESVEKPRVVFATSVTSKDFSGGVLTREFELKADQLPTVAQVNVAVPRLSNNWVYLEVTLLDSDGFAVVKSRQEVSYYFGVEGGESWSEGSQRSHDYVRLTKPGRYRLSIGGELDRYRPHTGTVQVAISIGHILTRWVWITSVLLLLYPLWMFLRWRRIYRQGWDLVDDDDDDD